MSCSERPWWPPAWRTARGGPGRTSEKGICRRSRSRAKAARPDAPVARTHTLCLSTETGSARGQRAIGRPRQLPSGLPSAWSGPRFFGLTKGAPASSPASKADPMTRPATNSARVEGTVRCAIYTANLRGAGARIHSLQGSAGPAGLLPRQPLAVVGPEVMFDGGSPEERWVPLATLCCDKRRGYHHLVTQDHAWLTRSSHLKIARSSMQRSVVCLVNAAV
jgi:hypothetical protein